MACTCYIQALPFRLTWQMLNVFNTKSSKQWESSKNRTPWDRLLNFSLSCLLPYLVFFPEHGQFYLLSTLTLVLFYFLTSASGLLKTCSFHSKDSHKTKTFWFGGDVLQTLACYIFISLSLPMKVWGIKKLLTKGKHCLGGGFINCGDQGQARPCVSPAQFSELCAFQLDREFRDLQTQKDRKNKSLC